MKRTENQAQQLVMRGRGVSWMKRSGELRQVTRQGSQRRGTGQEQVRLRFSVISAISAQLRLSTLAWQCDSSNQPWKRHRDVGASGAANVGDLTYDLVHLHPTISCPSRASTNSILRTIITIISNHFMLCCGYLFTRFWVATSRN